MPVRLPLRHLLDGQGEPVGTQMLGAGRTGEITIMYDDISGNTGNAAWLNKFRDAIQDKIDVVDPLSSYPPDDPDRATDPNREDFFHEQGNLVSRSVIIFDVTWLGDRVTYRLRRAKRIPRT